MWSKMQSIPGTGSTLAKLNATLIPNQITRIPAMDSFAAAVFRKGILDATRRILLCQSCRGSFIFVNDITTEKSLCEPYMERVCTSMKEHRRTECIQGWNQRINILLPVRHVQLSFVPIFQVCGSSSSLTNVGNSSCSMHIHDFFFTISRNSLERIIPSQRLSKTPYFRVQEVLCTIW